MRKLWMAAAGAALAGPAAAQGLNDAGRLLQQFLPGQQQPNQGQADRDRAIYEQGRRDAEEARRREGLDRGRDPRPDDRRFDDRRRADDRPRYDRDDRRRGDPDRSYGDDDRPLPPSGRYPPPDSR